MTEKDLVRVSKFTVTSADTDITARIRLGALVNFLIQSAIQSADSLGFGLKSLHKQKLFWVLSSLTVEVTRPLMWYENTEVETWPISYDSLSENINYQLSEGDQPGRNDPY